MSILITRSYYLQNADQEHPNRINYNSDQGFHILPKNMEEI